MNGNMMQMPLLISALIRHADRYHGDVEIVSRTAADEIHRYTYRDLHRRSRQLANALARSRRAAVLAGRNAGMEHASASGALLRHVRHRRGDQYRQSAAVPGADRVHRQPRRGRDRVLRSPVRAAGREDRAALPRRPGMGRAVRPRAHAGLRRCRSRATRSSSPRRATTMRGRSSTRTRRHRCATRRGPPATRRACCSPIARPCCTPSASAWPTVSPSRRAMWSFRSRRCSTSFRGGCRMRRAWSAPSRCCRVRSSTARACISCSKRRR